MAVARKTRRFRSKARESAHLTRTLRRLGKRIKALREDKEWTQEMMAGEAELDAKHLQEIEAGRINATMATVLGIARSLKVSLAELFEGV